MSKISFLFPTFGGHQRVSLFVGWGGRAGARVSRQLYSVIAERKIILFLLCTCLCGEFCTTGVVVVYVSDSALD